MIINDNDEKLEEVAALAVIAASTVVAGARARQRNFSFPEIDSEMAIFKSNGGGKGQKYESIKQSVIARARASVWPSRACDTRARTTHA